MSKQKLERAMRAAVRPFLKDTEYNLRLAFLAGYQHALGESLAETDTKRGGDDADDGA